MWECRRCHETCNDETDACGVCGTSRDGRADADFKAADEASAELRREGAPAGSAACSVSNAVRRVVAVCMLGAALLPFIAGGISFYVFGEAEGNPLMLLLVVLLVPVLQNRKWALNVALVLTALLVLSEAHLFFQALWSSGLARSNGEVIGTSGRAILCAWHLFAALWLCAGGVAILRLARAVTATERMR